MAEPINLVKKTIQPVLENELQWNLDLTKPLYITKSSV